MVHGRSLSIPKFQEDVRNIKSLNPEPQFVVGLKCSQPCRCCGANSINYPPTRKYSEHHTLAFSERSLLHLTDENKTHRLKQSWVHQSCARYVHILFQLSVSALLTSNPEVVASLNQQDDSESWNKNRGDSTGVYVHGLLLLLYVFSTRKETRF